MRFPPHLLDEIRARLPVSAVVARKVQLKKKGREFAGLSPFKSEKTPSFFVNDQKGFYHCFASGEHGDIFTFLIKTEGLSFPEAVERLATEAGVPLPKAQETHQDRERASERDRLLELLQHAATYFEAQLRTGAGRAAADYVAGRGLSPETLARFHIGFAPAGRNALTNHLKQAGFTDRELVRSGMQIAGEDISVPYDRFRNRVMFPIADTRGRIVAFGGRALDPNQPAKYLNSPETPLFHKGNLLFNAHRARAAAHDTGEIIVAEGYMDVIALTQAGFTNAVAPLGTALTPDQVQLLWRMCPEPTLCFDGDSAGQRAAHRAVDVALPLLGPGRSLHFAYLPKGLDPDDLIRDQGAGAMRRVLGARQPLAQVLWDREWQAADWSTPERRAKLEQRLQTLVRQIADSSVQSHYEQIIRTRLREAWRPAFKPGTKSFAKGHRDAPGRRSAERQRLAAPHSQSLKASRLVVADDPRGYREALLLRTLINHPWLIEDVAEELAAVEFSSAMLAALGRCYSFIDRP